MAAFICCLFGLVGCISTRERWELRERAREMFMHGYRNYITKAFPKDELKPMSCKGEDTFGGVQLTLIDSLDTLAVIGDAAEFERAARYLGSGTDATPAIRLLTISFRVQVSIWCSTRTRP